VSDARAEAEVRAAASTPAPHPGAASTAIASSASQPPASDEIEPPLTDWALRPFAAARSWLRVSLALGVGFAALAQCARYTLTPPESIAAALRTPGPLWADPFLWLDVLNGALFAYVPTALWLLRRGRLADLRELRPALAPDADAAALARDVLCVPPRWLALAGLACAALFGSFPLLDPAFWPDTRPASSDPVMLFFVARMGVTGWFGGHAVATELFAARGMARLGEQVRIDLFDLRPLAVFARSGQRSALAWVIVSSLISLFWLGPGAGSANAFVVGTILLAVSAAFAAIVWPVHRRIRAAKRAAQQALEHRIRERSEALLRGVDPDPARQGGPQDATLADLVAAHAYLERVREWPLNAPAIARGALIVALALGSWLGGALVERIVDRVIG
jgi:hypothetical protein